MARSVSRTRNVSKSPARRKVTSPKSEPKHKKAPASGSSRSRSASRARAPAHSKPKQVKSPRNVSRSHSRGRQIKALKRLSVSPKMKTMTSPAKSLSPKASPSRKPILKKTPSTKTPAPKTPAAKTPAVKTPAVKTPALKTPAPKVEAVKTPAPKPTSTPAPTLSSFASDSRPSRSYERKMYTSTPVETMTRLRYLRHESSSPSPVEVNLRKQPSAAAEMYDDATESVRAVGQSFCDSTCATGRYVYDTCRNAYRNAVGSYHELLVTMLLLSMILAFTYLILYTDPTKTRAFIHSIPGRVQAWYKRQIARKEL